MDEQLARRVRNALPCIERHCYVASEAYYHLSNENLKPVQKWVQIDQEHEVSHWWLENKDTGEIIDLTADQFGFTVEYSEGRGRGFLSKEPSRAAKVVIKRIESGQV